MNAAAASGDADALRAYYARRAVEYDRIYAKPERQADLRTLEAALPALFAGRRVLEIACGTGWWTPHGAQAALDWLATDVNPETLAIARARAMPACVRVAEMDAFAFDGIDGQTFDAAFAGHWWSHLSQARLPGWLAALHARLAPGARVVMLDNRFVPGSSTPISRRDAHGDTYQQRRLDDGSTHEVMKNFPDEAQARAALGGGVRDFRWTPVGHYWLLEYRLA